MKSGNKEFLNLSCNLYIAAMLAVLPLYTGQGYWQLGNTKYVLFRNITVLCLGCWLAVGLLGRLWTLAAKAGRLIVGKDSGRYAISDESGNQKGIAEPESGMRTAGKAAGSELKAAREASGEREDTKEDAKSVVRNAADRIRQSLKPVDLAVAAYGVTVLLSAVCSSYGKLAWRGYEGWFMGAFSQLLFVGIYFFVSRQQDGSLWPLYLGEEALFLATALGLLHRLGIDPLGLMEGWNSGDWEYSHMLSTLGNINWLCGYYSVALAVVTAHFLQERRPAVRCLLYIVTVLSFVLLGVQGSQGGLLILAVCAGGGLVCGGLGGRFGAVAKKVALLGAGFCLCMPLMWQLMLLRGKKAAIVADGNIFDHVKWHVWVLGAAACVVIYFFAGKRMCGRKTARSGCAEKSGRRKTVRNSCMEKSGRKEGQRTVAGAAAVVFAAVACIFVCCLAGSHMEDGFGSGRGLLWRISVESFRQADWKDKLLGAGPDCYAESAFHRLGAGTEIWKGEHWEGAVFTNAHNEVLSQLCNVGIVGTVSYLAIFLTAFWQYGSSIFLSRRAVASGGAGVQCDRKSGQRGVRGPREDFCGAGQWLGWAGMLAAAMYGAYALVSFQQVLSTPLLFLALGLSEAWRRRESDLSERLLQGEGTDADFEERA